MGCKLQGWGLNSKVWGVNSKGWGLNSKSWGVNSKSCGVNSNADGWQLTACLVHHVLHPNPHEPSFNHECKSGLHGQYSLGAF